MSHPAFANSLLDIRTSHDKAWKEDIFSQLQERNRLQRDCFKSTFETCGRLFESLHTLRTQNTNLTVQLEILNQTKGRRSSYADEDDEAKKEEQLSALQQKVYNLQDELSELHKRKAEMSQELLDNRQELQEQLNLIQEKERRIQEQETIMLAMRKAITLAQQALLEIEKTNSLMKDEQNALRKSHSSLEEKYMQLCEDFQHLLDQHLQQKAREVDRMNQSNESERRTVQKKVVEECRESVASVSVNDLADYDFVVMPSVCVVGVPSVPKAREASHEGEVTAVRWSPSGRFFATGGADRDVKLWQAAPMGPECRAVFTGSNAGLMSVDFDTSETLLAGSSNDGAARIWSLSEQRPLHTLTGHSGKVLACKFLASSNRVVTGSHDRTLKMWDLRSRACVQTFFAGSACNDVVTLGSQNVVSGHFDKKMRLWDVRTGKHINEMTVDDRITSLDISCDSSHILLCSRDDTLKVVDIRTCEVVHNLEASGFHVGCDWLRAVFSPDGQFVMAGSSDGSLFVWNLEPKHGRPAGVEKTLKEHSVTITACGWHPQGNQLVSCDKSNKVVVWSDY